MLHVFIIPPDVPTYYPFHAEYLQNRVSPQTDLAVGNHGFSNAVTRSVNHPFWRMSLVFTRGLSAAIHYSMPSSLRRATTLINWSASFPSYEASLTPWKFVATPSFTGLYSLVKFESMDFHLIKLKPISQKFPFLAISSSSDETICHASFITRSRVFVAITFENDNGDKNENSDRNSNFHFLTTRQFQATKISFYSNLPRAAAPRNKFAWSLSFNGGEMKLASPGKRKRSRERTNHPLKHYLDGGICSSKPDASPSSASTSKGSRNSGNALLQQSPDARPKLAQIRP